MKTNFILLLSLTLACCDTAMISNEDIEEARKSCKENGGVDFFEVYDSEDVKYSGVMYVFCKNGARFDGPPLVP